MRRWGYALFLCAFIIICVFPLLAMCVTGPSQPGANEILASAPKLRQEDGGINLTVLQDAGAYLADHFAFRQELITTQSLLDAALFRESVSQRVILGRDGWLFFADTLRDYLGEDRMSERELFAAARNLSLMHQYAISSGADFLFTVAPNKNTLYPQYMPDHFPQSREPGNLEKLEEALALEGVPYVPLVPAFRGVDRTLYLARDSHWNNLGAALAHDVILEALGRPKRIFNPSDFILRKDHIGDLEQMLFPAWARSEAQYYRNVPQGYEYARPIRSPEDNRINTVCDGETGSLLMFRDSFGNSLHTFMAESFGTAYFSRAMPYDMTLLEQLGADTMVVEIVQRNIPWLSQRPPVLPAPVRAVTPETRTQDGCANLSGTQTNGMTRIIGTLDASPDLDSGIYLILADGTAYEACLWGERGFSALLPQCPASLCLAYRQDGRLVTTDPIPLN